MTRSSVRGAWLNALILATVWMTAGVASAHPLGNFTVNRFSALEIGPSSVTVHYVVDMAEIPTFQELSEIDTDGSGQADAAELQEYADGVVADVLDDLRLVADDKELDLGPAAPAAARFSAGQGGLDILRIEITYDAALPSSNLTLDYSDRSFEGRVGWREIIAYGSGGQGIVESSVPSESVSDELRSYPKDLLSSPVSVTNATVEVAPGAAPDGGGKGVVLEDGPSDFAGTWFSSLIERDVSPWFFLLALLLSFAAGALHALGPGHGKTIMAAYLVGAEGRVRDALVVGVAVSVMHTASVIVLGLITLWAARLFPPEAVFPWLSLVSGLVVLALGAWLLTTRLAALRASAHAGHDHGHDHDDQHEHDDHEHDHEHVHHGHDHDHSHGHRHGPGHSHAPPPGASPFSARGMAAVALSGGLLPSPSALVVLLGAVALHRVAFGLVLVAAFSVGLAAALTAVGLLVIKARSYATGRFGARVGGALPILSAALITAVGIALTARAAFSF